MNEQLDAVARLKGVKWCALIGREGTPVIEGTELSPVAIDVIFTAAWALQDTLTGLSLGQIRDAWATTDSYIIGLYAYTDYLLLVVAELKEVVVGMLRLQIADILYPRS